MPSKVVLEITGADPPGGGPDQRYEEVIASFSSPAVVVQTGVIRSGDLVRFRCIHALQPIDLEVEPAFSSGQLPVHPDGSQEKVTGTGGATRALQARTVAAPTGFEIVIKGILTDKTVLVSPKFSVVVEPR
jgi:hypothetical protein